MEVGLFIHHQGTKGTKERKEISPNLCVPCVLCFLVIGSGIYRSPEMPKCRNAVPTSFLP